MPSSYTDLLTHLVFSTKLRENIISPELQPRLYAYIGGIAKNSKCSLLAAGGMPDHIHLLIARHPTIAEAEAARLVKANSSKWIHETYSDLQHFAWQTGYGAFSFGRSQIPDLERYIANQAEHHKRFSFQDEYRTMLRQHNIEYDERYIWD